MSIFNYCEGDNIRQHMKTVVTITMSFICTSLGTEQI